MNAELKRGLVWGLLATLCMTVLMLAATATGISPMPRPVPIALAAWALGALPLPALAVTGGVAHFAYGGIAGAAFAGVLGRRAGLRSGLAFGALLWLGMQVIFLPLLGWGLFGAAVTPRIAMATGVLHLVYGGVLGWGVARRQATQPAAEARSPAA